MNDTYINTYTKYDIVLEQIRLILFEIFPSINNTNGLISFYKLCSENQIWMKMFPIHPDGVNTNIPQKHLTTIHNLISKDRKYEYLHHLEHFTESYNSLDHFKFELPIDNILEHDDFGVNGKPWDDFDFSKIPETEVNKYDQLFLPSKVQSLVFIPIPLLSVPSIFIILPDLGMSYEQISKLIDAFRNTVSFYFYNRLMSELTRSINITGILDDNDLRLAFIDEVVDCLLPIKLKVGTEEFDKASQWPTIYTINDRWEEEENVLNLSLDSVEVKLLLSSFVVPSLEEIDNDRCEVKQLWIHKEPMFSVHRQQVEIMLNDIYKYVKQNFDSTRQAASILKGELFNVIHDPLKEIINTIQPISQKLNYINRQITPTFKSYLDISNTDEFVKIFDCHASLNYHTDGDSVINFNGIHELSNPELGFRYTDEKHIQFVIHLCNYFKYIKHTSSPHPNNKISSSLHSQDVISILSKVYHINDVHQITQEYLDQVYNYFFWFKHITYDVSDQNKQISFIQLFVYLLLGKQSNVYYFVSDDCYGYHQNTFKSVDEFENFFISPIWDVCRTPDNAPKVKLKNLTQPGLFLGSLAELLLSELKHGRNKTVVCEEVYISAVNDKNNIVISLDCSGQFEMDVLQSLKLVEPTDSLYHGLRSSIHIICQALGVLHFQHFNYNPVNVPIEDCFFPFTIFSYGSESNNLRTCVRLILGDMTKTWTCDTDILYLKNINDDF